MRENKAYIRTPKGSPSLLDKSLPSEKKFLDEKKKSGFNEDWDKQDEVKRKGLDNMTVTFGCTSFYSKMRWAWFTETICGAKYPLIVDRFYQEKGLAIDFKDDKSELKARLCKENGISYAVIKSPEDLKKVARRLS